MLKAWVTAVLLTAGFATAESAAASTAVDFGPSKACPTYCTGFKTDDRRYTLDWLNAVYANVAPHRTVLSVNGVTYSGSTTAVRVSKIGTHRFYQVDGRLQSANGSTLTVSYLLQYWTTRVVSGRDAGHIVPHRAVNGGQLTFP
jgi:hypothetical protein